MEELQFGELIPLQMDLSAGRVVPVQIMRPGTFVEMHGRTVEITEDDMETYVANFESGAAGQDLPVFRGHPPAVERAAEPAGAWFKRLYTRVVDGVKTLWADIELTTTGQEWLEGGMYRYLSPTVDLMGKIIRGGGFVNLPAIKGQPAIELAMFLTEAQESEGDMDDGFGRKLARWLLGTFGLGDYAASIEEVEMAAPAEAELAEAPPTDDGGEIMEEAQMTELRQQLRSEIEAEFAERKQEMAEFTERIRREEREAVMAEMGERQKLESEVAEFAASVTEGNAALAPHADKVKAVLLSLPAEQRDAVKELLSAKVVDLSEVGHTGSGNKPASLPDAMLTGLRLHLQGRTDVAEAVASFMQANDLKAGDYDLSEFLPKSE